MDHCCSPIGHQEASEAQWLNSLPCKPVVAGSIPGFSRQYYKMRFQNNHQFGYGETKAKTSFKVTVKLISTFVFTTQIVQFVFFLNPNFKNLACFCDCTGRSVSDMVRTPNCWFSHTKARLFS